MSRRCTYILNTKFLGYVFQELEPEQARQTHRQTQPNALRAAFAGGNEKLSLNIPYGNAINARTSSELLAHCDVITPTGNIALRKYATIEWKNRNSYFIARWKTWKLVSFTATNQELKPMSRVEMFPV